MNKTNCLFCKIIKKEIPCYRIYEEENFLAFLDIKPRNPGHTLVIPKKHYRWVWDIQEEYSKVVNKIAQAIKKALKTERVISFVIGEEIEHAHIHLVPRFPDDGHGVLINLEKIKEISPQEMEEIVQKIKNFL